MDIKKFEQYKFDDDNDNIGAEYAKIIISKFIDNDTTFSKKLTLENILHEIVKDEELDESQQYIIIQELIDYTHTLNSNANQVKTIFESEQEKFNL